MQFNNTTQLYHENIVEENIYYSRKFRYVAYRQLVRWCCGFLRKNNHTPLRVCVMSCIRNTFPANDGQYKIFD